MPLRVVFAEDNFLVRQGTAALLATSAEVELVEEDYAFDLLKDGVAGLGYLLKERVAEIEELVRALHEVARGGSALDPKVVEGLMRRGSAQTASPLLGLTDRE